MDGAVVRSHVWHGGGGAGNQDAFPAGMSLGAASARSSQPKLASIAARWIDGFDDRHRAAAAVSHGLRTMAPARAAALAIALYPAAAHGFFPTLGAEGVSELGRRAAPSFPLDPRNGIEPGAGPRAVRRAFLRRHPDTATGAGGCSELLREFEELSAWVRGRVTSRVWREAPACSVRRSIGLRIPAGGDACSLAWSALLSAGLSEPGALRERIAVPALPLVAAPAPSTDTHGVDPDGDSEALLEDLLLLGLSSATMYDPGRPVLWNRASLGRRLLLLDMRGFHGLG